ncbi:3'-5' exoribonuclease 1 isoform X3 [Cetorhinus maximus]
MIISNKRESNHCPLMFNGITITEPPTINILGATIDQKLNWTSHINTVATRAGQRLGILQRVTHHLTPQNLPTIYKEETRSVMEYSPLAWVKQRSRLDGQELPMKATPAAYVKDFSDPVYKEIAVTNGHINRMTRDELRTKLAELHLETRGVKDVLRKRLKNYYKKQKLTQTLLIKPECSDMYYDYICVIDFEATCEENNPPEYLHEIIEFPVALVNTRTLEIEDTFQEYVKPELKPKLTEFCTKLTGITQDMVDKAGSFPDVLQRVVDWMREKELGTNCRYAVLTDGSWDMSKFLNVQCHLSSIEYPRFAKKWINIRKCYGNFYKVVNIAAKAFIDHP